MYAFCIKKDIRYIYMLESEKFILKFRLEIGVRLTLTCSSAQSNLSQLPPGLLVFKADQGHFISEKQICIPKQKRLRWYLSDRCCTALWLLNSLVNAFNIYQCTT